MAEEKHTIFYPPVVAVLGHVDHGKTSLLDAIRQTSIAEREHGGITQKIGASSVTTLHDGQKRKITFIDTPGHEAFSKMRGRGAIACDIGLLVVSSTDGVMPQTRESINVLKASGVPLIVVLTKSDLQTKNPEKVKGQIVREGLMLEGMGGDIPVIEVSSKTKENIQELLDLILLVQELHATDKATTTSSDHPLLAIVIESKLDQKMGPRATVVVKDGTLKPRDELFSSTGKFKVRNLLDDLGKVVEKASVGDAVEILGFLQVPEVGSMIRDTMDDAVEKTSIEPATVKAYQPNSNKEELALILLADTQGSLEAITAGISDKARIITQKTGEMTEADILLAKSTGAFVIGFNSKIRPEVATLARTEKVLTKNYTVIYELLSEIADAIEGKELSMMEQIFGTAKVLAKFPFEKTFVLGVAVLDGRIAKGDRARIMRGDEVIGETQITSLRVGKNPLSKVEKGNEAGIIISPVLDFQVGDMVISHE